MTISDRRRTGTVLASSLHVVLLLFALGELVFLGSRYRLRFDTTSDDLYSLTDSTRQIVAGLDKRLVIEAYFSPKAELPAVLRDRRTVVDNFLDELVQLGGGKVVVQRFNPLEDKAVADKCMRIGVKPIQAQSSSSSSFELKNHWQGLRLVYGGGRQKVYEQFLADQMTPASSFFAETLLTPGIKEVVTKEKHRIGFMEWPEEAPPAPGQQPAGNGWNAVRSMEQVSRRYDFQNYKDAEGALVPDDVATLMLFRPKDLSDRQKYVLDQFLMRGGTLVVFAEAADYSVGQRRAYRLPFSVDAKDSQWKFQEQMLHYGVELKDKVVCDLAPEAEQPQNGLMAPYEYFAALNPGGTGIWVPYPYFFHAVDGDWAKAAEMLAKGDAQVAAQYRKQLRPGIDSDEPLFTAFRKIHRGPGLYWPCWTDLRRKAGAPDLPEGVDGKVLMWSSPLALAEDPPQTLDPVGYDRANLRATLQAFLTKLQQRLDSEPRQQAPLMLDLRGRFPSFFVGKPRPKKPAEIKEEEAKKAAEKKEAEEAEKKKQQADDAGKEPAKTDADKAVPAAPDAKPQEPAKPAKPEPGPAPKKDTGQPEPPKVQEPEPVTEPKAPGRIVVLADADFLRDDFVRGDYRNAGGPASFNGPSFFMMLVDWLSQDRDLVALQSRIPVDRRLQFVPPDPARAGDLRDAEQTLKHKTNWLVLLNITLPCLVLLAVGAGVWLLRRAQKKAFLAAVGN